MRALTLLAPAALLLLSACAGSAANGHVTQIERLSDDCEARGGVLAPTGQTTGRVETEYVCKITGQPSH